MMCPRLKRLSSRDIGREKSSSDYKEWMVDALADAADNSAIEGDDHAALALDRTERLGNYHQINRKDITVSGRADVVNKAGRRSELARQITKKAREMKRDIEVTISTRKIAAEGKLRIQAPHTAGIPAWIRTNLERHAGSGHTADVGRELLRP